MAAGRAGDAKREAGEGEAVEILDAHNVTALPMCGL